MSDQIFPPEVPQIGQKIRVIVKRSTPLPYIPSCFEALIVGRAEYDDGCRICSNYYYKKEPLTIDFSKKTKTWSIGSHNVEIFVIE